jgi:hypothetical protein
MVPFCSICISNIKTDKKYYMISTEECKHCFCLSCSGEWFYSHNKCPNCNTTVQRLLKMKSKNTYSTAKTILIIDLQNIRFYTKEKFIYLIKGKYLKKKKTDIILYKVSSLIDGLNIL